MRYSNLIFYCSILGLILVTGCKKKPGVNPANKYDFSVSGVLYSYNRLSFQSTAPAGSSFYWDFGDGAASADAVGVHAYSARGNYYVRLVVNGDTGHAVQKAVDIASTVGRMSGAFETGLWGSRSLGYFWPIDHSKISYIAFPSPALFTIRPLDESSIRVTSFAYNGIYYLIDSYESDTTITFSSGAGSLFVTYDHLNGLLYFDYLSGTDPSPGYKYSVGSYKFSL